MHRALDAPPGPATVALPWRLPNPPAALHGRFDARRRLIAAVRRGPLARVWGARGVGRTGLTLHALHHGFPERVPDTLYVSMARAVDARAGIGIIFRALQDGGGRGGFDWAPLLRDPLGAAALLIDAVDESGLWVVLDDLDGPAGAEWLLPLVARYARRARWIAIGEAAPPSGGPPGQAVHVPPLTADDLRAIALDWGHPPGPAVERAVEAADGAPRALDVELHGARPVRLTALLAHDPRERRLLGALAAVPDGLDLTVLDALDALPDEARSRALVEQGLVERHGDVLRLAAEPEVDGALRLARSAELDRQLLAILAAAPDAHGCMQALTLAGQIGERATLLRLLDARGDDLLSEGYAPQVAALLAHETSAELRRWRWQARCVIGDIDGPDLQRVGDDCHPRAVRYALNALGLQARWTTVVELSARCIERWGDVPEQAEWVAHVKVACGWSLVQLGRYAETQALLDGLGPIASPRMETMALALRAHLLTVAGEVEQALVIGRSMWRSLAALPERARKRRMYVTVHLFYQLQRYAEAEAVVESVIGDADWALLPVQCDRNVLVLLAGLYGQRGRFVEAERCARRAVHFVDNPSVRTSLQCIRAQAAIDRGALDGWAEQLESMAAAAGAVERADLRVAIDSAALNLQLARGVRPEDGRRVFDAETADPRIAGAREALNVLCALRRGEAVELPPRPADGGEAGAWWAIARATRRLLAGESAAAELVRTREPLRARGLGSAFVAVQQALCEALLLEGRLDALPAEAALLASAADESPRYRAEARFFAHCASAEPSSAVWRALAEAEGGCAARRRARALLGQPATLDALDRAIVAALRGRVGAAAPVTLGWSGAAPGEPWVIDGQRVQGPGGGLDLARSRVLWGLLDALAEAGGALDKEALVQAVWGVAEYHPLRHDNRLRVAVRKLRGQLAEHAGLADVLLTTDDGYALRGPCRRVPVIEGAEES